MPAPKSSLRRVVTPLVFACLFAVLGAATTGCGWTPPRLAAGPTPFDSPEERQQMAQASVDAAVAALDGKEGSGDRKAADAAIRDAVRYLGDDGGAYAAVGRALTEHGHPAEAAHLLDEATKNKDTAGDANLWAALAAAYEKAGDAAGQARASREADRQADIVMNEIGKGTTKTANDLAAEEAAARFLEAGAYFSDVKKNIPRALQALREAHRLMPASPIVSNALGYTLADKGTTKAEFDEAVRLTHDAVEIAPDSAIFLDSYGWALFKTGDLQGARRVLRKAVDGGSEIPECRYHLGVVYGQLGLINEARMELDRATTIRKNYDEAEQAKKQLKLPPGKGVTEGA